MWKPVKDNSPDLPFPGFYELWDLHRLLPRKLPWPKFEVLLRDTHKPRSKLNVGLSWLTRKKRKKTSDFQFVRHIYPISCKKPRKLDCQASILTWQTNWKSFQAFLWHLGHVKIFKKQFDFHLLLRSFIWWMEDYFLQTIFFFFVIF